MPGEHKSLYQYLENRYANTVALTFAQIEDLLGFTLKSGGRTKTRTHTTASFAIVDVGQQDSHAESAGPDRCF